MTLQFRPTGAPGTSCIHFRNEIIYPIFRNITNIPAVGEIGVFDQTAADTDVTAGANPGDEDYVLGNIRNLDDVALNSAFETFGFYGVFLEVPVDNEPVKVQVSGIVSCKIANGLAVMTEADHGLVPAASTANLVAWDAGAVGNVAKVVGNLLTDGSATLPALTRILFDGVLGLGMHTKHA